jgi:hypothetical protein
MEPVSPAPSVQGQSSQDGGESKPRRRAPAAAAAENAKAEVSESSVDETEDLPLHRVDSLA